MKTDPTASVSILVGLVLQAFVPLIAAAAPPDEPRFEVELDFVPLVYLRGDYRFTRRWHLLLEAEALGGGPGRAADGSRGERSGKRAELRPVTPRAG